MGEPVNYPNVKTGARLTYFPGFCWIHPWSRVDRPLLHPGARHGGGKGGGGFAIHLGSTPDPHWIDPWSTLDRPQIHPKCTFNHHEKFEKKNFVFFCPRASILSRIHDGSAPGLLFCIFCAGTSKKPIPVFFCQPVPDRSGSKTTHLCAAALRAAQRATDYMQKLRSGLQAAYRIS